MKPIYLQQYERVKRFLNRIEAHGKCQFEKKADLDDYEDDFLAFCLFCWHLKDWIDKAKNTDIYDEIKGIESIMICRDIATAAKHVCCRTLLAGAETRVDCIIYVPTARAYAGYEPVDFPPTDDGVKPSSHQYLAGFKGDDEIKKEGSYEPSKLARQAVNDWEIYMRKKGLLD